MTLFGFADADERHCFRVLLGAKGVGAKLALAVLAVHTPDALRRAIASRDVAALTRVPGLGPKGAQRVIIDVGDKLGAPAGEEPTPAAADAATTAGEAETPAAEATAAEAATTTSAAEKPAAEAVPSAAESVQPASETAKPAEAATPASSEAATAP